VREDLWDNKRKHGKLMLANLTILAFGTSDDRTSFLTTKFPSVVSLFDATRTVLYCASSPTSGQYFSLVACISRRATCKRMPITTSSKYNQNRMFTNEVIKYCLSKEILSQPSNRQYDYFVYDVGTISSY